MRGLERTGEGGRNCREDAGEPGIEATRRRIRAANPYERENSAESEQPRTDRWVVYGPWADCGGQPDRRDCQPGSGAQLPSCLGADFVAGADCSVAARAAVSDEGAGSIDPAGGAVAAAGHGAAGVAGTDPPAERGSADWVTVCWGRRSRSSGEASPRGESEPQADQAARPELARRYMAGMTL
jgi:hypothetical protein